MGERRFLFPPGSRLDFLILGHIFNRKSIRYLDNLSQMTHKREISFCIPINCLDLLFCTMTDMNSVFGQFVTDDGDIFLSPYDDVYFSFLS